VAWVGGGRESEEANVRFVLTNTTMETTVLTTHTHTHTHVENCVDSVGVPLLGRV